MCIRDSIPGVGPKRAKALLTTFGSLAKVRTASKEEIAAVPGFNEKLAEAFQQHLAPQGGAEN